MFEMLHYHLSLASIVHKHVFWLLLYSQALTTAGSRSVLIWQTFTPDDLPDATAPAPCVSILVFQSTRFPKIKCDQYAEGHKNKQKQAVQVFFSSVYLGIVSVGITLRANLKLSLEE